MSSKTVTIMNSLPILASLILGCTADLPSQHSHASVSLNGASYSHGHSHTGHHQIAPAVVHVQPSHAPVVAPIHHVAPVAPVVHAAPVAHVAHVAPAAPVVAPVVGYG